LPQQPDDIRHRETGQMIEGIPAKKKISDAQKLFLVPSLKRDIIFDMVNVCKINFS
jgi:hypothetical protein